MDEKGIVIRNNKDYSVPFIAFLGSFIVVVGFGCFFKAHKPAEILAGVIIMIGLAAAIVYLIKQRREQGIDLAISMKGIYLDGKGLYPWSLIESFSTTEHHDDSVTTKLILHFRKYEDEDYDITHLDIKTKELVEYLLYYKGTFTTYYVGHTKTGN
ncbi:MAG TPA: hypothetical protein VIM79_00795 [Niastella sp.]